METFFYKANTEDGNPVTGTIEADNVSLVAAELYAMGYIPLSISEKKKNPFDRLTLRMNRVSLDDQIFFTRQLYAIIKSGMPILSGLNALGQQLENKRMKEVIIAVTRDVDKGQRFSAALAKHPDVFSELYVNMIDSGETGGSLEDVLEKLISALEFNRKTKENLKVAIRYPMMVVVALGIAFSVLVTAVIPKFAKLFEKSAMILPLPTRIMIGINYVVQNYWPLVLAAIFLSVAGFYTYVRTKSGRLNWDRTKLQIPVIGPVFMKIYLSRFAGILETLTRTGISMDTALELVSRNIGNEFLASRVRDVTENVRRGLGLTRSLIESKVFPPLVIQMVLTGEESGALDDMLHEVNAYYEREVDYTVSRLSSYIEPILTIGLGVMVLFLALAIFLPWWDSMQVFKGGGK